MDKNKVTIMLDNGHGWDTAGKRSPDKRLMEWKWAREMAKMVMAELKEKGYKVQLVVPEDNDIKLRERCRRINAICSKEGAKNVVSVSIHVNAAGSDSKWHDASGFTVFVSPNASANSKKLAKLIAEEAYQDKAMKGNRWIPKEEYFVKNLMMCRDTNCPAVLVENMFMDNKKDVDFLLSDEGKKKLCDIHVNGIIKYIAQL